MTRLKIILASIVGVLALALLALYFSGLAPAAFAAMVIDSFRTANDPPGTLVVERRESSSNKGMGIVTWHTEGFNQKELRVIDFRRTNLVNKRSPGE